MGQVPLAPGLTGNPPAAWFVTEMLNGIVGLCRQALNKRPETSEAELEMAEAWAEVAWQGRRWDPEQDVNRIRAAFSLLAGGHRENGNFYKADFPLVSDLLHAMPRRHDEQADTGPQTEEEKERAQEASRRFWAELNRRRETQGKAAESATEKLRTINAVLRHKGLPVFRNATELRRHQVRQREVGELIEKVKL